MRSWKKIIRRRLFSAVIKPLTTYHEVQLQTIRHHSGVNICPSRRSLLQCRVSKPRRNHVVRILRIFLACAHVEFPICGKTTKITYTGEQRLNKQMSIVDTFLQQSTLTPYSQTSKSEDIASAKHLKTFIPCMLVWFKQRSLFRSDTDIISGRSKEIDLLPQTQEFMILYRYLILYSD